MFNDEAQPGDLNMNCEFIGGIRVGVGFREGGLGGGGGEVLMLSVASGKPARTHGMKKFRTINLT